MRKVPFVLKLPFQMKTLIHWAAVVGRTRRGWKSVDAVGRQLLDEIPEEAGNKASTKFIILPR